MLKELLLCRLCDKKCNNHEELMSDKTQCIKKHIRFKFQEYFIDE